MLPLADLAEKKKMTKEKGVWDDKGYDKKSLLTVWRNQNNPVYIKVLGHWLEA